jgi:hypothetical protein
MHPRLIEDGKFPWQFAINPVFTNGCKRLEPPDLDSSMPKIVCIGCSVTYGYISAYDDQGLDVSYPHFLGRLNIGKYSVLNMGVWSYGLKLVLDWFSHHEHAIRNIDMVIIQLPEYERQPLAPWQDESPHHYTCDFGARFLLKESQFHIPFFRQQCPDEPYEILSEFQMVREIVRQELMEKDFERIKKCTEYLANRNIKTLIMYYKYWSRDGLQIVDRQYYHKILDLCRDTGALVTPVIDSMDWLYKGWLLDWVHLNAKGSYEMAKLIQNRMSGVV